MEGLELSITISLDDKIGRPVNQCVPKFRLATLSKSFRPSIANIANIAE